MWLPTYQSPVDGVYSWSILVTYSDGPCGYQPTSHRWMVYIHGPFGYRPTTNLPVTGGWSIWLPVTGRWCIFMVHLVTNLPVTGGRHGPFGYQPTGNQWMVYLHGPCGYQLPVHHTKCALVYSGSLAMLFDFCQYTIMPCMTTRCM